MIVDRDEYDFRAYYEDLRIKYITCMEPECKSKGKAYKSLIGFINDGNVDITSAKINITI